MPHSDGLRWRMQATQAANLATDPATSSNSLGPAASAAALYTDDSATEAPALPAQPHEAARLDPARERQLERQARGSYIDESNMAVGRRAAADTSEQGLLGRMQSPFSPSKDPRAVAEQPVLHHVMMLICMCMCACSYPARQACTCTCMVRGQHLNEEQHLV